MNMESTNLETAHRVMRYAIAKNMKAKEVISHYDQGRPTTGILTSGVTFLYHHEAADVVSHFRERGTLLSRAMYRSCHIVFVPVDRDTTLEPPSVPTPDPVLERQILTEIHLIAYSAKHTIPLTMQRTDLNPLCQAQVQKTLKLLSETTRRKIHNQTHRSSSHSRTTQSTQQWARSILLMCQHLQDFVQSSDQGVAGKAATVYNELGELHKALSLKAAQLINME